MKNLLYIILLGCLPFGAQSQTTPDEVYAGDHFSLEAALDLFKNVGTLEEFETQMNAEDNAVNNLDLDEDGNVDYIRVIDNVSEDVHAIVLQVDHKDEAQDIAVIEIEKTGESSAILQIIGNEDVFGEEIIAEPFEEASTGREERGPNGDQYFTVRIVVNVWGYRSVRHIYSPNYVVWVSPYRYNHYPRTWKPRRKLAWRVWQPRTIVWGRKYHRVNTHRVVRAHKVYVPKRRTSVTVRKRTTVTRTKRKNNGVVTTRKTTTKVKKKGRNGTVVSKKKKTRKTRRKKN